MMKCVSVLSQKPTHLYRKTNCKGIKRFRKLVAIEFIELTYLCKHIVEDQLKVAKDLFLQIIELLLMFLPVTIAKNQNL